MFLVAGKDDERLGRHEATSTRRKNMRCPKGSRDLWHTLGKLFYAWEVGSILYERLLFVSSAKQIVGASRFKTVWCLRTIDGLAKTPSSSWETIFIIIRKILIVTWVWSLRIRAAVCYGWLVPTLLWRRPGSWIWNICLNILRSGNE